MDEDEAEERKIADQYIKARGKLPTTGILISENFSATSEGMLVKALKDLLDDEALQAAIRQDFGRSFHDVNAIVFPAWEAIHDKAVFGFTDVGRDAALIASRQVFAAGFTVHDRHNQPQATIDGVPRIGIDREALYDQDTVKLTLFHELFHAMNVPKHEPPWYTVMQNDLVYCDEYRDYVKRFGFKYDRERNIWIVTAIPMLFFLYLLIRHLWWVWLRNLWFTRLRRRVGAAS
ncbi:MAG: hypothetical protein H7Z16_12575 [Pyrinomonadaceae bacterium]|nr:hypothetical protein [Pyrinomonadaceae bacterium]